MRLGTCNRGFSSGGWVLVGERGPLSDLCLDAVSRISCSSLVPKSRNSVKFYYSMYNSIMVMSGHKQLQCKTHRIDNLGY